MRGEQARSNTNRSYQGEVCQSVHKVASRLRHDPSGAPTHTHTAEAGCCLSRECRCVCVCASVFVGIRERLHSFLCMCVSELSGQILGTFESLNFSLTS